MVHQRKSQNVPRPRPGRDVKFGRRWTRFSEKPLREIMNHVEVDELLSQVGVTMHYAQITLVSSLVSLAIAGCKCTMAVGASIDEPKEVLTLAKRGELCQTK